MKTNKVTSAILALAISGGVFAACSTAEKTQEPTSNSPTVLTINDYSIRASEYAYSLNKSFQTLDQQLGGMISANDPETSGITDEDILEMVKGYALSTLQEEYAMRELEATNGMELSKDDEKYLNELLEQSKEQIGGEEEYKKALKTLGITEAYFEEYNKIVLLFENMVYDFYGNRTKSEDELYKIYENDYMHAKHILIPFEQATEDLSEEDALISTQAKAKGVLDMVQKAPEDFDMLMASYSTDYGQPLFGYAFSEGDMVPEFEAAVKELEVGETSDLVETTYGYHIIQKIEPNKDNFEANRKAIELGEGDVLANAAVTAIVEEQEVTELEGLAEITLLNYADYLETDE